MTYHHTKITPWAYPDFSAFEHPRFGVFRPDGRFDELPNDFAVADKDPDVGRARWAGGHDDLQLLRAAWLQACLQAVPDAAPIGFIATGTDETGQRMALHEYAGRTELEVKNKVIERARREGYKGTISGRLYELGWCIEPIYLIGGAPAAPETLHELAARIRAAGGYVTRGQADEIAEALMAGKGAP